MQITKELIYCIGLWLAEGDSKTSTELTFTNNSLELILFFKENIDKIYSGINIPRLYVYSATGIKYFEKLDGFKTIKSYIDVRANRPYYIYRLADTKFMIEWKKLVKEIIEQEQFEIDILIGIFAGEGNIKHDIKNHNSRNARISSKYRNSYIEKALVKLKIPIKFDQKHKEYWITGRYIDILNSNSICILHPEKSHKFKKMFESKKEEHYSPYELKNNLIVELNEFKTAKELSKKYNRSHIRITEVLQQLKKENYSNHKKINGKVYWAKKSLIEEYNKKLIENIKESMNRHGKNYTAIGKEIGLYRKSVKREIDKNLQKG